MSAVAPKRLDGSILYSRLESMDPSVAIASRRPHCARKISGPRAGSTVLVLYVLPRYLYMQYKSTSRDVVRAAREGRSEVPAEGRHLRTCRLGCTAGRTGTGT